MPGCRRPHHRNRVAGLTREGGDAEGSVHSHAVRRQLEDRVPVFGNETGVFPG